MGDTSTFEDKMSGLTMSKSTVFSEEKVIYEFKRVTRFSLDNISILTRSNIQRCLLRHGLNRLPKEDQSTRQKKSCKDYPIDYVEV